WRTLTPLWGTVDGRNCSAAPAPQPAAPAQRPAAQPQPAPAVPARPVAPQDDGPIEVRLDEEEAPSMPVFANDPPAEPGGPQADVYAPRAALPGQPADEPEPVDAPAAYGRALDKLLPDTNVRDAIQNTRDGQG
ncbi:MAG: hypothetical protein AAF682_20375, partial [Planctomycetota bacterium]